MSDSIRNEIVLTAGLCQVCIMTWSLSERRSC